MSFSYKGVKILKIFHTPFHHICILEKFFDVNANKKDNTNGKCMHIHKTEGKPYLSFQNLLIRNQFSQLKEEDSACQLHVYILKAADGFC